MIRVVFLSLYKGPEIQWGRCTIKELGSLEQHPHTAPSCENVDLGDVHPIKKDGVRRGLPQPIEGAQQC